MFDNETLTQVRDLRLDYKFKCLEKVMKDYFKESLEEFLLDLKKRADESKPLMNIGDISLHFKVCKATIHNWINRGMIAGTKVGKNRYFTVDEVREAIRKHGFDKQLD